MQTLRGIGFKPKSVLRAPKTRTSQVVYLHATTSTYSSSMFLLRGPHAYSPWPDKRRYTSFETGRRSKVMGHVIHHRISRPPYQTAASTSYALAEHSNTTSRATPNSRFPHPFGQNSDALRRDAGRGATAALHPSASPPNTRATGQGFHSKTPGFHDPVCRWPALVSPTSSIRHASPRAGLVY